ncbi:MAG: tyrosine-type recombinase/integrase [Gemmatimonadota bacterium]|nr:tyrosine-type recombinase/integrase [Gemmatimonadota bacterium]
MKRRPYRLTTAYIRGLRTLGCYGDGRGGSGLQIRVHRTTGGDVSKSWRQKLKIGGKPTSVGLGSFPFVTLADARKLAAANRAKVLLGIDPRTDAVAQTVAPPPPPPPSSPSSPPPAPSFDAAAAEAIALHRGSWKAGGSTEGRWRRSLAGLPFGSKRVSDVTKGDVFTVIQPRWTRTPVAARGQLDVIRAVFDWSIGAGHRTDNPVDAVKRALPKTNGRKQHHKAVPVADAPRVMARLRKCSRSRQLTRLTIEFQVLTATRPGEATGARWSEIKGDLWTIPGSRMKTGEDHRVPLSAAALAVLEAAASVTRKRAGLIFPSEKGKVIGGSSLASARKTCGIEGTSHGFRSSFRDWCAETGVAREVAEACLAHTVGGVEGAYFRSDILERRRPVMGAWGRYLAT